MQHDDVLSVQAAILLGLPRQAVSNGCKQTLSGQSLLSLPKPPDLVLVQKSQKLTNATLLSLTEVFNVLMSLITTEALLSFTK